MTEGGILEDLLAPKEAIDAQWARSGGEERIFAYVSLELIWTQSGRLGLFVTVRDNFGPFGSFDLCLICISVSFC